MTTPSTSNQLPTVWLAPPEGLLPSNHTINVEPAPIAISSVLALLILLVVTLLFNKRKNKGNYLDDTIEETQAADKELFETGPRDIAEGGYAVVEPTKAHFQPASRDPSMHSNRNRHKGMKKYSSENRDDPWEDSQFESPTQVPKGLPKMLQPSPVRDRKDGSEDDTTLGTNSTVDFDDESALDSEASFGGFGPPGLMSTLNLPGYPASYNPSEFKPLAPEEIGMHGEIWK